MFKVTHKRPTLILIGLLFFHLTSYTQHQFPKGLFQSPVDSNVLLAGNFAELRNNHFHGGLDVKTGGQEGRPIYSVYDGYVSKIKINHKSYGKMLYITHPNGYISVYAHLSKYSEKIDAYLRKYQYEKKTYEIELYPDSSDLPVKTKELVALSGNTGGSTAPHLHFEIRDAKDNTYNPILFGFDVEDHIKPSLYNLGIFPLADHSLINNKSDKIILKCSGTNGNYKIKNYKPITVSGPVGLGISTLDFLDDSHNRCGIYSIDMYVDSELVFSHILDQIPLDETRYINSLVDYETWKKSGLKLQKCFLDPGNHLSTYKNLKNQGILDFKDKGEHHIRIVVKDGHLNSAELFLTLLSEPSKIQVSEQVQQDSKTKFKYNQMNRFENASCIVSIPEGRLYHDIDFKYEQSPSTSKNFYSDIHKIHHYLEPLHKPITLSIKTTKPCTYSNKLCIVAVEGDRFVYEGGSFEHDFVTTTIKNFGNYAVMADTTAPYIGVLKLPNHKNKFIQFKISDNLSGIESYQLHINNHFLLMEYEYKNATLTYYPDDYFPKERGEYDLVLTVKDKMGNERTYKTRVRL